MYIGWNNGGALPGTLLVQDDDTGINEKNIVFNGTFIEILHMHDRTTLRTVHRLNELVFNIDVPFVSNTSGFVDNDIWFIFNSDNDSDKNKHIHPFDDFEANDIIQKRRNKRQVTNE